MQDGDILAETAGLLSPQEQLKLSHANHYPHFVLDVLNRLILEAGLTDARAERLFLSLSAMNKAVATCEKILHFPIPLSYTRHTSRFLFGFLLLLPLALWDDCSWGVVPITTMLSFLLLGVEVSHAFAEEGGGAHAH